MDKNFQNVTLRNGTKMPSVGLGTFLSSPGQVKEAVRVAVEAGYRHIDTAQAYENEAEIGESVQQCINYGIVTREEMFITTKLCPINNGAECVRESVLESLENLRVDYIDLFLIHFPVAFKNLGTKPPTKWPADENGLVQASIDIDYLGAWEEMEKLVDEGLIKVIGLSNFNKSQVERVYNNAKIKPSNLQVECHARFPQHDLAAFCQELGISFTAYAPLGSSGGGAGMFGSDNLVLLEEPVVKSLAVKYNRTPAQILLRNLLQRGLIVLPKSVTKERIISNAKLFDFELSSGDMQVLEDLKNKGSRLFDFSNVFGKEVSYRCVHYPFELPLRH